MSIKANSTALASDFVGSSSGVLDVGKVATLNTVGQFEAGFFKVRKVTVFKSSGTFVRNASTGAVMVQVQGPGGGGGQGTTTNNGGGGSAGTYAQMITSAAIFTTTSIMVLVGTGGAGHTSSSGSGNDGSGPSAFGVYISCAQGQGGTTVGGGAEPNDATGTGVNFSIQGQAGSSNGTSAVVNFGGSSFLGHGGGQIGHSGQGYGGGGAAGNASAANGGNGSDGIVVVTEYFT